MTFNELRERVEADVAGRASCCVEFEYWNHSTGNKSIEFQVSLVRWNKCERVKAPTAELCYEQFRHVAMPAMFAKSDSCDLVKTADEAMEDVETII